MAPLWCRRSKPESEEDYYNSWISMNMRKKDDSKKVHNLLDLIPVHNRTWIEIDDERLAILQPRLSNRIAKKWIESFIKLSDIRIKLDAYGSFVWKQCNGTRTVREIGEVLKERFGSSVDPAMDRLELFLKYLERYEFITYSNISE